MILPPLTFRPAMPTHYQQVFALQQPSKHQKRQRPIKHQHWQLPLLLTTTAITAATAIWDNLYHQVDSTITTATVATATEISTVVFRDTFHSTTTLTTHHRRRFIRPRRPTSAQKITSRWPDVAIRGNPAWSKNTFLRLQQLHQRLQRR